MNARGFFCATALLVVSTAAMAQPALKMPEASPKAAVSQTVGITDITVDYHRPAVNGRRIWGGLVGYGAVWRAGANESTKISFSTPVKVEGQTLPAGDYSLFMIPTASQVTVIFNKFTGGWGAYSYDPSEDALRVNVTPQTVSDSQERLLYTFDDPTDKSTTLSLRWEKLRVPVKIEADTPALVTASIRSELRSGKHWNIDALTAAARWNLRQGNLDEALDLATRALDYRIDSGTLRTKAAVLDNKGDAKGAAELRERAKTLATEGDTVGFAYTFAQKKQWDEGIKYLTDFAATHPQSWRAYSLLGEFYANKGDHAKAKEQFDKAMSLARDTAERVEVQDSINTVEGEKK